MSAVLSAFGVEGTVTPKDGAPIETQVAWLPPLMEDVPSGMTTSRREFHKVLGMSRAAVPSLPTDSTIEAPEEAGGEIKTWRVRQRIVSDIEEIRVVVTEVRDVET